MANKSLRRVFWKRNRHCFARSIFVAQSQIFAHAPPMSSLEYLGSSTRYPVVQPAILARPWLSWSSRVNFVWTDYHTCFSIIGLQRILSFSGGSNSRTQNRWAEGGFGPLPNGHQAHLSWLLGEAVGDVSLNGWVIFKKDDIILARDPKQCVRVCEDNVW